MNKFNSASTAAAVMLVWVLILVAADSLSAHFIWVAKNKTDGIVNVYFGEGPYPDQAQFLSGIEAMKVWSVSESGEMKEVAFSKKVDGDDGWFEVGPEQFGVDVDCDYGIFGRGGKKHVSALLRKIFRLRDQPPVAFEFQVAAGHRL